MHGYFVDLRLYEKARSILNPFDYEDFKKSQVDAKIQKERESRISVSAKNRPKINRALADKLIHDENAASAVVADGEKESKKNKKSKSLTSGQGTASNPLGDDRFADLFKDSEFEIDMESREYKLHHPTEVKKGKVEVRVVDLMF
jgi:ribosome biogenesis protein ENP2